MCIAIIGGLRALYSLRNLYILGRSLDVRKRPREGIGIISSSVFHEHKTQPGFESPEPTTKELL